MHKSDSTAPTHEMCIRDSVHADRIADIVGVAAHKRGDAVRVKKFVVIVLSLVVLNAQDNFCSARCV